MINLEKKEESTPINEEAIVRSALKLRHLKLRSKSESIQAKNSSSEKYLWMKHPCCED